MVSFQIPALSKRVNQTSGHSWRILHAERIKWRKWVMLASSGQRPAAPYPRATVRIIRVSSRCPDFDGLVSSGKQIIDALKYCGIIEDDSMAHIGAPTYEWLKGKPKEGKTIVTVTPIDKDLTHV